MSLMRLMPSPSMMSAISTLAWLACSMNLINRVGWDKCHHPYHISQENAAMVE